MFPKDKLSFSHYLDSSPLALINITYLDYFTVTNRRLKKIKIMSVS